MFPTPLVAVLLSCQDVSLADLDFLPHREAVIAALEDDRRMEKVLFGGEVRTPEHLQSLKAYLTYAQHAWMCLSCARDGYYSNEAKLSALRRLKAHIGAANYYHGWLPPALPMWAMEERD